MQKFIYDESAILNSHEHIFGNMCKGWSLATNNNIVDIGLNEKILNFTSVDKKIIDLYPVYEPLKFKVIYRTNEGRLSNGQKILEKVYCINENTAIETVGNLPDEEYFLCWNMGDKHFYNMNDLIKYIDNLDKYFPTIHLSASFFRNEYAKSERTGGSEEPSAGGGLVNKKLKNDLPNDDVANEVVDNVNKVVPHKGIKKIKDKILGAFSNSQNRAVELEKLKEYIIEKYKLGNLGKKVVRSITIPNIIIFCLIIIFWLLVYFSVRYLNKKKKALK